VSKQSLRRLPSPHLQQANYYDIVVGDGVNRDAVWYYATPSAAAIQIEGRCAFWHGVQVVE